MKIIKEMTYHSETIHELHFEFDERPGCGTAFKCDSHGVPILSTATDRTRYEECIAGYWNGKPIHPTGMRTMTHEWREPSVGQCCCGRYVELDGFTCPCDCGRDYNWAGQQLAPRECWGEETGEHWSDVARL